MKFPELVKIVEPFAETKLIYRNHFALGCYFLMLGRNYTGLELCNEALRAGKIEEALIDEIMTLLPGREEDLALAVKATNVVISLFQSESPDSE